MLPLNLTGVNRGPTTWEPHPLGYYPTFFAKLSNLDNTWPQERRTHALYHVCKGEKQFW